MLITNFNFGPCRESKRHNCSNFDFDSFRESQPGFIIQITHSITSLIQNVCELGQKIEFTATAWFLDIDSQRPCEVGRSPELSYISLTLWASKWLAFPTCPETSHDPFNDCLHDLLRVAFWKEIRPYCHGVSTCEDCMDVLRRHSENVAWIKSYPETTLVQSFVAFKKWWPKMKTVETQWVLSKLSAMQKQDYSGLDVKNIAFTMTTRTEILVRVLFPDINRT